jgi:hypothetical protein
MNIQEEEDPSDQETAREESETPRSQDQRATIARDFIEDRNYDDAFIDGDAPR